MAIGVRRLDTETAGYGGEPADSLAADRLALMALTGEAKENTCRRVEKLIRESEKPG